MIERLCRTDGCRNLSRPQRRVCSRCKSRQRREQLRLRDYGDPHFSTWTVADEYDVELIARERRPADGLTRLERFLVAKRMTEQGATAREIAQLVGVEQRTVHRWRAKAARHLTPAQPAEPRTAA